MRRYILYLPLATYSLLALAYVITTSLGFDTVVLMAAAAATGSFAVYYYAAYLLVSVLRWSHSRRAATAMAAPFGLLGVLLLLDVSGISGTHLAHGMTLPNALLWAAPGGVLQKLLSMAVVPAEAKSAHPVSTDRWIVEVKGGLPQPDGSLVLYGIVGPRSGMRESWRLLARLNAAGQVDETYAPTPAGLQGMVAIGPRADGRALLLRGDAHQPDVAVMELLSLYGGRIETARPPQTHGRNFGGEYGEGDIRQDAKGRLIVAGPLTAGGIVRFTASGRVDRTFHPEAGEYVKPHILPAPDGSIFVQYHGTGSEDPGLRRLLPDGRTDTQFQAVLARTLAAQDMGNVERAALDARGRVVAVLPAAILRLDANGRPIAPGATPVYTAMHPNAMAVHPNGSIYVAAGANSEYPPVMMRFDADLRENQPFAESIAKLAGRPGEIQILGMRLDGGVIVSIFQNDRGSRVYYLGPHGSVIRTVQF